VNREAALLGVFLGCGVIAACSTAKVSNAGQGPCEATYDGCDPRGSGGCGGDPSSPSYDIKTLSPEAGLPIGCTVRTFDEARNLQGQCVFQESCTCVAGDAGVVRWACAP
jgi:hypothetical protein